MLLLIYIFSINKSRGYENPSLEIIVRERCSIGGCPLEEACEHFLMNQSVIFVVVLGDTIVVRRPIGLSKEGFRKSRLICTQVFSDALPVEGVPIGVTRVANRCALKNHLYFLRV